MRAAIVLAAGRSRRFGSTNKLLVRYRGRILLHHALAAACAAPVGRVLVVVGRDPRVARSALGFGDRRIAIVGPIRSASRRESLAAGLAALRPIEREVLVYLGDMPFIDPRLARAMTNRKFGAAEAVRPVWRGRPGHPVLLRNPALALTRIAQGKGPFADCAVRPKPGGRGHCLDVDSPGDLRDGGAIR